MFLFFLSVLEEILATPLSPAGTFRPEFLERKDGGGLTIRPENPVLFSTLLHGSVGEFITLWKTGRYENAYQSGAIVKVYYGV